LAGIPPAAGRVAVITPYAAQARLLGAFIRDRGLARIVRALIDRLVHHAEILSIEGGQLQASSCRSSAQGPTPSRLLTAPVHFHAVLHDRRQFECTA
jgi:hypothetical protein